MFKGEKLTDNEVAEITKDCMDPEDEDGMIPYARKFLLILLNILLKTALRVPRTVY